MFMGAGFLYIVFQAILIVVSLYKISTGTVGGWVVTARKAQKFKPTVQEPTSGDMVTAAHTDAAEPYVQV